MRKNNKNQQKKLGLSNQLNALLVCLLIGLSFSTYKTATAQTAEPMRDSATVIMYHRFGEGRYPSTNISMEQFEEHLALLTNGDYTIMPLPEIIEKLRSASYCPIVQ